MNNQSHSSIFTFKDFKRLKKLAEDQFEIDFKTDPDNKGKKPPAQSEIYGLAGYTTGNPISISYYLIRNPEIRGFLLNYYSEEKPDKELKVLIEEFGDDSDEVSKRIRTLISDKYFKNKEREFIANGVKGEDEVKIKFTHKHVFELYTKRQISDNEIIFDCYYFSATEFRNKVFKLRLDKVMRSAYIEGFHDNLEDVYSGGFVHTHELAIYITLERNVHKKSDTSTLQGDLFHLTLFKGKSEIEELSLISGSFLATTKFLGWPIASEVLCVNKSALLHEKLSQQAVRHLSLKRNRIKVFPGFKTGDQEDKDYVDEFGYSPLDLQDMIGTYLVGRIASKPNKEDRLVVSILRINSDFSASLLHPMEPNEEMICLLNVTCLIPRQKVLIVNVFQKNKHNPYIILMINIPRKNSKETDGKYSGVTDDKRKIIGGRIVLHKESDDPLFDKESLKWSVKFKRRIPENSNYDKLYNRLTDSNLQ